MNSGDKLPLFTGFGVEIEYAIVDKETLQVLPIVEQIFKEISGTQTSEYIDGDICFSNELTSHVMELKTNGPAKSLETAVCGFQKSIQKLAAVLRAKKAILLPTGAHPFMDPLRHTVLWPYANKEIYESFDRIFGCQGHGWSNLQSTHLNLPFANEEEFIKLHAAIRILLPIIPALSASTPILEGKITGYKDTRLEIYRKNQQKIPSICGDVIPESIGSIEEYKTIILKKMYNDISPYDPLGVLQDEWLNSRGAIARFERNTVEIRIIDTQECVLSDLAILEFIIRVLKDLVNEKWATLADYQTFSTKNLVKTFLHVIEQGSDVFIYDQDYLKLFGYNKGVGCSIRELWRFLKEKYFQEKELFFEPLSTITNHGNLAERIIRMLDGEYSQDKIKDLYSRLGFCLYENKPLTF